MEQQDLFKARDRRKKGWFWLDNDYLNGFAKFFGPTGTAIYVSLCRHTNNETQKCFPAIKTISEENNIGESTVKQYLHIFEKYHLIMTEREKDPKTKKWLNNVYTLLDKSEWITPDEPLKKKRKRSQSQQLAVDSQSQRKEEPEPTVDESQSQPLAHNYTNIKGTYINNTNNSNASVAEDELSKKASHRNNPVSLIVDFFYRMNDWPLPSTPAEQKLYRRWLRPAKDLLELCDGSVEEANSCIKKVGDWAISHQLSWGIETVFKKWYDLDLLKPKEKKPYYDGKRIFQKTEGGKYYVISRDGEIKELGITPKKEDIVWK